MNININVIIDRINSVVILSYDSNVIEIGELENFKEDIKSIYGYEVMALANADVTII